MDSTLNSNERVSHPVPGAISAHSPSSLHTTQILLRMHSDSTLATQGSSVDHLGDKLPSSINTSPESPAVDNVQGEIPSSPFGIPGGSSVPALPQDQVSCSLSSEPHRVNQCSCRACLFIDVTAEQKANAVTAVDQEIYAAMIDIFRLLHEIGLTDAEDLQYFYHNSRNRIPVGYKGEFRLNAASRMPVHSRGNVRLDAAGVLSVHHDEDDSSDEDDASAEQKVPVTFYCHGNKYQIMASPGNAIHNTMYNTRDRLDGRATANDHDGEKDCGRCKAFELYRVDDISNRNARDATVEVDDDFKYDVDRIPIDDKTLYQLKKYGFEIDIEETMGTAAPAEASTAPKPAAARAKPKGQRKEVGTKSAAAAPKKRKTPPANSSTPAPKRKRGNATTAKPRAAPKPTASSSTSAPKPKRVRFNGPKPEAGSSTTPTTTTDKGKGKAKEDTPKPEADPSTTTTTTTTTTDNGKGKEKEENGQTETPEEAPVTEGRMRLRSGNTK